MNTQSHRMANPFAFIPANDFEPMMKAVFTPQNVSPERASGTKLAIDLLEKESSYEIRADLPGINIDDINIILQHGVLTITAEAKSENSDEPTVKMILGERRSGAVSRSVKLGKDVDEDSISANYTDGVLTVTLTKSDQVLPKKIAINA